MSLNGTTGIVYKQGHRVRVKDKYGTVRFVGNTQVHSSISYTLFILLFILFIYFHFEQSLIFALQFAPGIWIGVELDTKGLLHSHFYILLYYKEISNSYIEYRGKK